jgi:hypothetical protein
MFVIVGLSTGGKERKENRLLSYSITSVKVEDIRICMESC